MPDTTKKAKLYVISGKPSDKPGNFIDMLKQIRDLYKSGKKNKKKVFSPATNATKENK